VYDRSRYFGLVTVKNALMYAFLQPHHAAPTTPHTPSGHRRRRPRHVRSKVCLVMSPTLWYTLKSHDPRTTWPYLEHAVRIRTEYPGEWLPTFPNRKSSRSQPLAARHKNSVAMSLAAASRLKRHMGTPALQSHRVGKHHFMSRCCGA
jgi:hypothetical protein